MRYYRDLDLGFAQSIKGRGLLRDGAFGRLPN